jgi:hypothetical protein
LDNSKRINTALLDFFTDVNHQELFLWSISVSFSIVAAIALLLHLLSGLQ